MSPAPDHRGHGADQDGSPDAHASDSSAQRAAEPLIIAAVAQRLARPLRPTVLPIEDGVKVQIDGATKELDVLVEAYAHVGPLRGGQPKKLATDAFKLQWIGRRVGASQLILAVADLATEAYLTRPRAWLTQALADAGIAVIRVDLDEATVERVRTAQEMQYR